jgi:hypothetical protein
MFVIGRELYSACTLAFMLWVMNYIQGMPCLYVTNHEVVYTQEIPIVCYGSWILFHRYFAGL